MKDKLRELAESWKKEPHRGDYQRAVHACADDLIYHLDAEGDGGAVAYICHKCNKAPTGLCSECAEKKFPYEFENTHPARSGVVSDEDVEEACRKYYNCGHPVYPPVFEGMRAALEHFARRTP